MQQLVIGTRGSQLALYQANFIKKVLLDDIGRIAVLKIIKTTGDKIDHISFDKMEGKGFFTKELEEALLSSQIDLAVHSLKDLMTTLPDGLMLGAAGFRVDPREMLLINPRAHTGNGLIPVKEGAVVGTSSARRQCQLLYHSPTLQIKDLRGNVPTRVDRLRSGQYDAIVVAAAGLDRLELDLSDLVAVRLDPEQFLPAPAQGLLGIEIRSNDPETASVIAKLDEPKARIQVALERGLLARYDSGCSLPLGVVSDVAENKLRLKAVLGVRDGRNWIGLKKAETVGNDPAEIVQKIFETLQESDVYAVGDNPK